MRIGIDATAAAASGTGIQTYAHNLTKNLLRIDEENEYVVYHRGEVPKAFLGRGNATFRRCPFPKRKLCEQVWLAAAAPRDRLDVLHCIASLPLYYRGTSVLTIHGFSWRLHPEVFTRALRYYWILTAERTLRTATRLIAISGWTKDVILRLTDADAGDIDVVHHGVDHERFASGADEVREVRDRYGLAPRSILYVGTFIPVKNLPRLLRAFQTLIRDDRFGGYQLVLAGSGGWAVQEVSAAIDDLGIPDRVRLTGYVPDRLLPALYHAADLFVLPSLYEGFGLPILESFAAGTPVVTSNASCLPEIAGDAALLFDPEDSDELARAMARVLSNSELHAEMVRKGRERAASFSWSATARRTLEVYGRARDARAG